MCSIKFLLKNYWNLWLVQISACAKLGTGASALPSLTWRNTLKVISE